MMVNHNNNNSTCQADSGVQRQTGTGHVALNGVIEERQVLGVRATVLSWLFNGVVSCLLSFCGMKKNYCTKVGDSLKLQL